MREVRVAVPGDLATPTGGYAYARRLIAALPATGWAPRHLPLPGGFPFPSGQDLLACARRFGGLPADSLVLVDGLAFGALPVPLLQAHAHRWVALVHHPLALESGLSCGDADRLRESERAAFGLARAVIATSAHTAETLAADYGVPRHRLHVAPPGTDPAARAEGSRGEPALLAVGTLTARKGHDLLLRALAPLRDLSWRCRIIGSRDRDPVTAARLADLVVELGLAERVTLEGEATNEELDRAYHGADVFVLASRHEGYGMAFAEALARGLPVVGCAAGAVPETVPAEAGLLVPPDDVAALAEALRRLLVDPGLRRRMADAARMFGRSLPTWSDTAAMVAACLSEVAA